MLGYSNESKGYRLLEEKSSKVFIRRDVIFNETDFGQRTKEVNTQQEKVEIEIKPEVEPDTQNEPKEPRRSERQRQPPVRYGLDEYADTAATTDDIQHVACHVRQIEEPKSIEEALSSEFAKEWKVAADSEYESLIENQTWDLVELPDGRKPIGCKWVFKVKHTSDGKVERFKARLVAKGYAQKYGIDYDETFSPVVRFSSIRALLAFAVQNDMLIHQMDVVTAFLNGELKEEIYMQQPDGYLQPGKEELVCKLKKSLYGLKQSPRCWNTTFEVFVKSIKFESSAADPCIYVRGTNQVNIVAVYVRDLIVATTTPEEMLEVKEMLKACYKMKDMGELHYCLGISIDQNKEERSIWIHQKQYILNMLEKYGLTEAKIVATPADKQMMESASWLIK